MKRKGKNSYSIRVAVIGGVIVALILIVSTLLMGQSAQKGTQDACAPSVSCISTSLPDDGSRWWKTT